MADNSKIEWTETTLNPTTGCTKVSPGCDNCYAERIVNRFKGKGAFDTVVRDEGKLFLPFRWRRPRLVFVNSMSDVFHKDVPDSFIANLFSVMARTPQHTYQILTKRHDRMKALLNRPSFRDNVLDIAAGATWPLLNAWMGVSVESQKWADIRIAALRETPAAVRFVSAEPLLGPLQSLDLSGIGWLIAGGESGPGARPMHPDWARGLRDQCVRAGVPFFFKQWGEWEPLGPLYPQDDDCDEMDQAHMDAVHLEVVEKRTVVELERDGNIPDGYQPGDPRTWLMARVGKKRAGRELDGKVWDQYPQAVRHA